MAEKEIVYAAMYNPMTEESSYGILSIHRSKENAEKVIAQDKDKAKAEHDRLYKGMQFVLLDWDGFQDWCVN